MWAKLDDAKLANSILEGAYFSYATLKNVSITIKQKQQVNASITIEQEQEREFKEWTIEQKREFEELSILKLKPLDEQPLSNEQIQVLVSLYKQLQVMKSPDLKKLSDTQSHTLTLLNSVESLDLAMLQKVHDPSKKSPEEQQEWMRYNQLQTFKFLDTQRLLGLGTLSDAQLQALKLLDTQLQELKLSDTLSTKVKC